MEISGPVGPRAVVDGRPVLTLCSDDHLGLAAHPDVRAAAADAALRWGAAAGALRLAPHAELEARLAAFHGVAAARLVELAPAAGVACEPPAALRAPLVHVEGVRGADGSVAPLPDLLEMTSRLVVDETHAVGVLGPGGRGAVAEACVAVELILGSLGHAMGSYGRYVAGSADAVEAAAPVAVAATPPPPAVGAALAALGVLEAEPERVDRLRVNGDVLRAELTREGFAVANADTQIVVLDVGDAAAVAAAALSQGVLVRGAGRTLRLTVMATHTRGELREAAQVLARATLLAGEPPPLAEVVPLRAAA